ncbi:MAG: phospholipid carrier-dependent glycosyltransferase, partial [Burkholderiales bacterium]
MPRRAVLAAMLSLFAVVWFGNIESRKLIKPDEGRYAEVPREMVASGDWLTPRLNGIKYFEKPPLQYWATATAYSAFGLHHWTARLWSALTGLLGIFVIWFTGRRLYGEPAGILSALVAASSVLYVALAHMNTLDMGLTFFMGSSLCTFLLAQRQDIPVKERKLWMALSWAATAAAILSKGLVALILPGLIILIYSLVQRDWRVWLRLDPLPGVLLLAAIAAPWFVFVSAVNPEFPGFFFIHEHFTRFLTHVHRRVEPWWFFVPILLAGLLPWTVTAAAAVRQSWRAGARATSFDPGRFLVIWFATVFVFFSLSGSKLPSYILPMFPAAALVIGRYITQASPRAVAWQLAPMAVIGLVLSVITPFVHVARKSEVPQELYANYAIWLQVAGAVGGAGAMAAIVLALRKRAVAAVAIAALGALLCTQIAVAGHDSLNYVTSAYHLAQKIKPVLRPDVPFYSVRTYEQTLPFYIGRTLTLVEFADELEFGLEQEPNLWVPTLAEFEQRWASHDDAFAVMAPNTYRELYSNGLPMEIVASDPRRVVVRKK